MHEQSDIPDTSDTSDASLSSVATRAAPNNGDDAAAPAQRRRRRLRAEAAVWMIRLDAGRARESDPSLARWCARSQAHRDALASARESWSRATPMETGAQAAVRQPDRSPLRDRYTTARMANRRPSASHHVESNPASKRASTTRWNGKLGAGIGLAAIVCAVVVGNMALTPDFKSDTGAVRTVALADGSVMRLDAQSAVDVHYTNDTRQIVLREGRVAFDVAHGDRRPFVVDTAGGHVTDIGTAFQIDSRDTPARPLTVTVTQGAVRFSMAGASMTMHAGDVAEAMPDTAPSLVHTNADSVIADTAWQRGRLQFDDSRLADVISQLNRYFPGHHIFLDAAGGNLRVSGNFALNDPATALATLVEVLHLQETRWAGRLIFLNVRSDA
ncbi:FecR domain-containing protein [Robbsia sp. KACC 23696]|uniref:FecR family protein n=1 Tax=Robbsia sp. KACC 23696 TaxID=3149231 RepID=UPI00325BC3EC